MMRCVRCGLAAILAGVCLSIAAAAADATVAVAANFTAPAKEIAAQFQAKTGYSIDFSFGSSGQLYTQISQGAPFDLFLSADDERTALAVKSGLAVPGTDFTYAIGRLALWSADPKLVDKAGAILKRGGFTHIAIANPKTAPYGAAAMETLRALGLADVLSDKIVTGESISQTLQFVVSRNAELGFVAYSQVQGRQDGSIWLVPEKLYKPIVQNAVLLKRGSDNKAAKAFYAFLKGKEAAAIIHRYGYATKGNK